MADTPKTILVVEDEKSLAKALSLKLGSVGYTVSVAENGQAALDILAKQTFDLVLLDIVMPDINGFAVLEELKRRGTQVKVVVASNLGQAEDIEKAKALGALDFYVKSNTPLSLIVTKVQTILKG